MDQDRASDAIEAFRSAENAVNELISNASELTRSAESIRDTDQSVKSLAGALGIAAKQWVDIATEMKSVTAEVQAAGKLLQKAEPQELMHAIDETTTSVGELRKSVSDLTTSVDASGDEIRQLTARVEMVAEGSTNLREALIAKMDLQQSSLVQLQSGIDHLRSQVDARSETLEGQIETRSEQVKGQIEAKSELLESQAEKADQAQSESRDTILTAVQRTLYASSAAALFALIAIILAIVL